MSPFAHILSSQDSATDNEAPDVDGGEKGVGPSGISGEDAPPPQGAELPYAVQRLSPRAFPARSGTGVILYVG